MPTAIDRRNKTDNERPHDDQKVRGKHVYDVRIASNLFKNIESVALHDICCLLIQ